MRKDPKRHAALKAALLGAAIYGVGRYTVSSVQDILSRTVLFGNSPNVLTSVEKKETDDKTVLAIRFHVENPPAHQKESDEEYKEILRYYKEECSELAKMMGYNIQGYRDKTKNPVSFELNPDMNGHGDEFTIIFDGGSEAKNKEMASVVLGFMAKKNIISPTDVSKICKNYNLRVLVSGAQQAVDPRMM